MKMKFAREKMEEIWRVYDVCRDLRSHLVPTVSGSCSAAVDTFHSLGLSLAMQKDSACLHSCFLNVLTGKKYNSKVLPKKTLTLSRPGCR